MFFSFFAGFIVADCARQIVATSTKNTEALLVAIILTCFSYKFMFQSIIIPWNTIFTYSFFALLTKNIVKGSWQPSNLCWLIVNANLAFFCRPQDGFFSLIFCLLFLVYNSPRQHLARLLSLYLILCSLFSVTTLFFMSLQWDGELSSYLKSNISHGFNFWEVPSRLYTIFFNGSFYFYGEHKELFVDWLEPSVLLYNPLSCLGLCYLIIRASYNWYEAKLFTILASPIGFYLAFNPTGNAVHFWTYSLFHYIWIYTTLLAVFGYLAVRRLVVANSLYIPALVSVFFCFILVISTYTAKPSSTVLNATIEDNEVVIGPAGRDIKKIKFHLDVDRDYSLFTPGAEYMVSIYADGKKLIPWRDYYLNSGDGFYSITFVKNIKRESRLSVSTENKLAGWLKVENIHWNFF